jgi:hypothetical protein
MFIGFLHVVNREDAYRYEGQLQIQNKLPQTANLMEVHEVSYGMGGI